MKNVNGEIFCQEVKLATLNFSKRKTSCKFFSGSSPRQMLIKTSVYLDEQSLDIATHFSAIDLSETKACVSFDVRIYSLTN